MTGTDPILREQSRRLARALEHLRYSYKKVRRLGTDPAKLNEEQLEIWESFSARFARVADLFLTRYLRSVVIADDPGFDGTVRDIADQAEKLGVIESADRWMAIRKLRNISAHEYTDDELGAFFKQCRGFTEEVLRIERALKRPRR